MGKVPTISINKTDGCHVYLSKSSLKCEIVSAKSSEMNILVPTEEGDFVSKVLCLPERNGESLKELSEEGREDWVKGGCE